MSAMRIGWMMADQGYDPDLLAEDLAGFTLEDWSDWPDISDEELTQRCRKVDVVITGRKSPKLPAALSEDPGRLKLLAHCHGTVKHLVDIDHIRAGIKVSNWGGEAAYGVAESAMALTLTCLKQIALLDRRIRSDWTEDQRLYQDFGCTLRDRDVGVYGMGPIGSRYAQLVSAFDAKVHYYDPFVDTPVVPAKRHTDLASLFDACQIISIHCGLNDATRHSVTADLLGRLPQGAVVINTARGGVIKEEDLITACSEGRLIAGLDVIERENQWAQNPLAKLPNVVLTGHTLGGGKGFPPDRQRPRRLSRFVVENCRALADGKPLQNLVTAEVYDIKT